MKYTNEWSRHERRGMTGCMDGWTDGVSHQEIITKVQQKLQLDSKRCLLLITAGDHLMLVLCAH